MAFERLSFTKDWTNHDDFSTYEDSEAQVREDLQFHPNALRDYLNEVLLAALEDPAASRSLGAAVTGISGTLQDVLDAYLEHLGTLDEAVRDLAAGESPEAVRAARVEFTEDGWTEVDGSYELRILQSQHTRLSDAFGYSLKSLSGESCRADTWETACTDVAYDEETADIVLTAENPYDGVIVFFGV